MKPIVQIHWLDDDHIENVSIGRLEKKSEGIMFISPHFPKDDKEDIDGGARIVTIPMSRIINKYTLQVNHLI